MVSVREREKEREIDDEMLKERNWLYVCICFLFNTYAINSEQALRERERERPKKMCIDKK